MKCTLLKVAANPGPPWVSNNQAVGALLQGVFAI